MIVSIDRAIMKLPTYKGTVYRSIDSRGIQNIDNFWEKHKEKEVVLYDAFLSSSKNVYDSSMNIQYSIISKNGHDMSTINENEQEVLFSRSSAFVITRVEENHIWMEEI